MLSRKIAPIIAPGAEQGRGISAIAHRQFVAKVDALKAQAEAKRGQAEHITDEEINGAIAKCDEVLKWAQGEMDTFTAKPLYEDSALAPTVFDPKAKEAEKEVKAVINKKAPPPPPKEEEKKDDAAPTAADAKAAPAKEEPKGPEVQTDMD